MKSKVARAVPVPDAGFDLIVYALGYESRCTFLLPVTGHARRSVALPFVNNTSGNYSINRAAFLEGGVSVLDVATEGQFAGAFSVLVDEVARTSAGNGRIAIDISSFTRIRIAQMVEALVDASLFHRRMLQVRFYYSPAVFSQPNSAPSVLSAHPVTARFRGRLRRSSVPLGAVLGLGYEPQRALGAFELLEPARTWIFSPVGGDQAYEEAVTIANEELIESIGGRSTMLKYPIGDPETMYASLESFVFSTMDKYRLVLVPMGPKIFALACLILSVGDTPTTPAVWRVGEQEYSSPTDSIADGSTIYLDVNFDSGAVHVSNPQTHLDW